MRYGIFSDVHSNLEALESVLSAFKEESIDAYLCIGDVIGYAANPCECIRMVKGNADVCIAGNHDWASVDKFNTGYFNPLALAAIRWTSQMLSKEERVFLESLELVFVNKDLTLVHGTLDNPQEFDYLFDGDDAGKTFAALTTPVCFVGHTHVAGILIEEKMKNIIYRQPSHFAFEEGNRYIVNVGSVGQPRDGIPDAAYCVYDTAKKEVAIKRVPYDMELARKKIIEAGLPQRLGDRLLVGH
jgi:predicted phosphodiesterase